MTDKPTQTTKWDRAREILDQMNALQRELEGIWPAGFGVTESNRYWRKQLVTSGNALLQLRMAAVSGVDMERVEKYGEAARRV